ncbi:MAG: hypothetical protein R3B72_22435 [Polyangiaceae bacterium]
MASNISTHDTSSTWRPSGASPLQEPERLFIATELKQRPTRPKLRNQRKRITTTIIAAHLTQRFLGFNQRLREESHFHEKIAVHAAQNSNFATSNPIGL